MTVCRRYLRVFRPWRKCSAPATPRLCSSRAEAGVFCRVGRVFEVLPALWVSWWWDFAKPRPTLQSPDRNAVGRKENLGGAPRADGLRNPPNQSAGRRPDRAAGRTPSGGNLNDPPIFGTRRARRDNATPGPRTPPRPKSVRSVIRV